MRDTQRVALVTGASSGIGECSAALLAERGFRVWGASRSARAATGVRALAMDVTSDTSVGQAIETILRQDGRLDIVVNNAGMALGGAIEDTTVEEARRQFEVNFFGVLRVCRAVLPVMRARGSGYLVNVGSIGGLVAIPYQGLYSASKFAIDGLTEALRVELRPFGIHAVLIEPGDHRTGLTRNRRLAEASDHSPYHDRAERAIARMALDEQSGAPPEAVARVLLAVVNNPRPRLRYTVGPASQRAAVWMKRLLPFAVTEAVVGRYYSRGAGKRV